MRWHRLLTCELNLHNYPQGIATSKRVKFWWTRDEWFKLRRIFKHDWPQYLIFPLYARATKLLFKALADPEFSGQAVTRTVKNISVYNGLFTFHREDVEVFPVLRLDANRGATTFSKLGGRAAGGREGGRVWGGGVPLPTVGWVWGGGICS